MKENNVPLVEVDLATSDVFLDVKEAAAMLRLSEKTVYGLVHQRRIPFRKHGSRLVFSRAALMFWSKANEYGPLSSSFSRPQERDIKPRPRNGRRSLKIEIKKGRSSHRKEM